MVRTGVRPQHWLALPHASHVWEIRQHSGARSNTLAWIDLQYQLFGDLGTVARSLPIVTNLGQPVGIDGLRCLLALEGSDVLGS